MDNRTFDRLTKAVAAGASRRGLLKSAGAGVAAALAGGLGLGGAQAEKRERRTRGRLAAASEPGSCPSKVCHCPPGQTQNCQATGDGGGHLGHDLDCCCGDADCNCAARGSACCKPTGESCANSSQCCDGGSCCGGKCQVAACCVPRTCATNYAGKCGTFSDNCGDTVTCTCSSGCCDGSGNCQPGNTNAACGTSGACATCTAPKTCGGGGTAGVCGCTAESKATTCGTKTCGTATNNCGDSVTCGTCDPAQCLTCQADGTCGTTCQEGFECKGGGCVPICPNGRPVYCSTPKGRGFKCCPADECCNYQPDDTVTCGVAGTCPPPRA